MTTYDLALILGALVLSALFSGLEIAFVSANRLAIEVQRKQGTISARLISGLVKRPSRVIGTLLVGNNVAMVIYGIVIARVLEPLLASLYHNGAFVLVSQTIISTLIILIIAEFLPKVLFRIDPNGALNLFAVPLRLIYILLWLPMMLMTGLSELVLRAFGVRSGEHDLAFGRMDLDELIKDISDDQNDESVVDMEIELFRNAMALSEGKARERMVPRSEIQAIEVNESIEDLLNLFVESGRSKILVFRGSIDNIIGYVHSFEMFRDPRNIRSIVRQISFVPGTMPADDLLQMFIKQRSHMAVVVDEFGGTAGLVTMEDLVELIVGDIEDEHDEEEWIEDRIGENEYRLSARIEVDHLIDEFNLKLPVSDDYDTFAGFILHNTEEIPQPGAELTIGPFLVVIEEVSDRRIDLVRLKVVDPENGYLA